jgi:hypothetical protein
MSIYTYQLVEPLILANTVITLSATSYQRSTISYKLSTSLLIIRYFLFPNRAIVKLLWIKCSFNPPIFNFLKFYPLFIKSIFESPYFNFVLIFGPSPQFGINFDDITNSFMTW